MYLTEEEAKGKRCPQMIWTSDNDAGWMYYYCIASECMMWRWRSEDAGYCGLAGPIGGKL